MSISSMVGLSYSYQIIITLGLSWGVCYYTGLTFKAPKCNHGKFNHGNATSRSRHYL